MRKMNPVYLASMIIVSGALGFIVLSWVLGNIDLEDSVRTTLIILRHGCEGAFVGGICDFIAVRNVYSTARRYFPGLRDNTTRIVVKDMIKVRQQLEDVSQIQEVLSSPEYQVQFVELLEEAFPSKDDVNHKIRDVWMQTLRPPLEDWLLNYTFKGTPRQFTERHQINTDIFRQTGGALLREVANQEDENALFVSHVRQLANDVNLHELGIPSEVEGVKHLLNKVWEQWKTLSEEENPNFWSRMEKTLAERVINSLSPAIAHKVQTTSLEDALSPFLSEEALQGSLIAFAEKIEEPSATELFTNNSDLLEDIVSYWFVFLHAWETLDEEYKREFIQEVMNIIEPSMMNWLTVQLWEMRTQLLSPQELLEREVTQQLLGVITQYLKEQSGQVEETSIALLQAEFDRMGADGFVTMLQKNTKRQLDWIKVNGSAWGFFLGLVVGIIGWTFENWGLPL